LLLRNVKVPRGQTDILHTMRPVIFRCPTTGKLVQHFLAHEPAPEDQHRFDTVRCNACGLPHLINRATGKALGQDC
jgi:hypothetical protein